jgi:hypothetical protein
VPEPIQNEPHPIFKSIEEENLKEVNEIINKDPSALGQEDSYGNTPIFYAIFKNNKDIAEAIIEKYPSVLEKKNSYENAPIFYAIMFKNLEITKAIIEKYPSVLEQKDSHGNTPIFCAIIKKNKEIAEAIIGKNPSVLEQKNSYGNTPIVHAAFMSIMSSDHDNEDNESEVLQIILDYQFQRHIDKVSQEDFKELLLKKMLLKGIYSREEAFSNLKYLEKAFDKITPESTFKKIYQDLFENVDKNQPITSIKKEKMFVFQSKLNRHSSFFIFYVNKANELTSISYCDGNKIDERRKIEGSATHINGVTTFSLETPIKYDNDFAKDFINENTKDKSPGGFYDKLRKKEIIFKGKRIDFSEITHSIPTKIQKRNNCFSVYYFIS